MRVLIGLLVLATIVVASVVGLEVWAGKYGVSPAVLTFCHFFAGFLLFCYILSGLVVVQPKTAVIRCNLSGRKKTLWEGLHFLFRPFERLGEINGATVFNVQKRVFDIKLDVESKDEEVLKLDLSVNFQITDLLQFLEFSDAELKESISEHAKALASERARLCKDRDEIMDQKADIEDFIHFAFQRRMFSGNLLLEEYHGIKVDTVVISDHKLPPELEKAEVEREIAEKRAEAQVFEAKGLSKAAKALQGRTKKGEQPAMSKEKAVELELIRTGKIKKENKENDIGPNLKEVIDDIPKGFLGLLGSVFGPKGGKRKGKKGGP